MSSSGLIYAVRTTFKENSKCQRFLFFLGGHKHTYYFAFQFFEPDAMNDVPAFLTSYISP